MRSWVRSAAVVVTVAAVGETLAQIFLVGRISAEAGSWVFSAGFTAVTFGLIFLVEGWVFWKREPEHVGVSRQGIHRDVRRSAPNSPAFIPWNAMVSVAAGDSVKPLAVTVRTQENRRLSFRVGPEGVGAILDEFESARRPSPAELGVPGIRPIPPSPPLESPLHGSPVGLGADSLPPMQTSGAQWRPNSLRWMWMVPGIVLVLAGVASLSLFWHAAVNSRGSQLVLFLGLPVLLGLIMIFGSARFPSSLAITGMGFLVRTRRGIAGLEFSQITAVSTTGLALECTVRSGRTLSFQSLGPREKQAIQDAYLVFRRGATASSSVTNPASAPVTWLPNPEARGALAAFVIPLAIFVGAIIVVVPLAVWRPGVYGGDTVFVPLAALPATLTLFTIGPYRRAPKAVGLSEQGIQVRYPHRIYPASALREIDWKDVERIGGRHDRVQNGSPDPSVLMSPGNRYVTLTSRLGVTYTLGPVSSEIAFRILRMAPTGIAVAR